MVSNQDGCHLAFPPTSRSPRSAVCEKRFVGPRQGGASSPAATAPPKNHLKTFGQFADGTAHAVPFSRAARAFFHKRLDYSIMRMSAVPPSASDSGLAGFSTAVCYRPFVLSSDSPSALLSGSWGGGGGGFLIGLPGSCPPINAATLCAPAA